LKCPLKSGDPTATGIKVDGKRNRVSGYCGPGAEHKGGRGQSRQRSKDQAGEENEQWEVPGLQRASPPSSEREQSTLQRDILPIIKTEQPCGYRTEPKNRQISKGFAN
jgi:hypothetical protein